MRVSWAVCLLVVAGIAAIGSGRALNAQQAGTARPSSSKTSEVTPDSVIAMVQAGLSDDVIIARLRKMDKAFDLSPEDMINLKKAKVSDEIVKVMLDPKSASRPASSAVASQPAPAAAVAPAEGDLPPNLDIGIYYKKGGKWEEMMPEVVNWKTGGVVKHFASAGVVRGDVNGHIPGPHSRNSAVSPVEVLIYAPEGVAITEYQLLHLRENADSREFRTVTGGVLHESGGATRDVMPFEGKKIGNRLYKVLLPNIGAGEYGFLPAEAVTLAKGASIGKIYSFRLIE